jgi:hypothetical protein
MILGLCYVSLARINVGRGLILISVGHDMIQIRLYEYSYSYKYKYSELSHYRIY